MPIVSQGATQEFRVGATDGIFVKCTGSAAITYDGEYSAPTLADTSTGEVRCGYFGVPATIRVNCVSGTCEVNTQPTVIKPLVSKQSGAAQDSSALDVAQAVNTLNELAYIPSVNYELQQGQPVRITNPVTKYGKVVANFMPGQWTATIGSPTLTQGFTGYDANGNVTGIRSRTGQQGMLLVEPTVSTTTRLQLGTPATNILTPQLNGKIGLWVYIQPSSLDGSINFSIRLVLSTGAGATTDANALLVSFLPNTLREGWNFLTFVMRDDQAYVPSSGVTELHPDGISCAPYGTGVNANIKNNPITLLWVEMQGTGIIGSKIYFDSIWTDFAQKPQIVLGCDGGINDVEIALPIFQRYGWVGYTAFPYRVWSTGSKIISDLNSNTAPDGVAMYGAGWDFTNHTANHLRNGDLTSPAEIDYELTVAQAWQNALGFVRGAEFYVSPQSSTSRLSEKVISGLGYKLQRHSKHRNNHVTPFGIDNMQHVGSYDIGSRGGNAYLAITGGVAASVTGGFQQFSRIKNMIDIAIAYGYADFPFWHGITTVGDDGSGEQLTGDNLLIYASAFTKMCEYIREKELAGEIEVCRGMTGFYYGATNA